ncbi:MAG: hypothetical protein JXA06_05100 [Bacteroidetes bacterium]|nr:hypothetical protein [Bacteroidota bacterium]
MKKKSILIILFIVAGFIDARSQWIQDPVLHKKILTGIDKLYNFEFDRADSDFTEVVRMRPDHPAGHFFKAMVLWERIISNFDDESQDDELYKVLDVVIEMCEQRLDENPDDVTALFFNGGAVGFRGRLRANRGKWIGAANDGVIAMPLVRRAYELEPNNYDVLLGIGIYNYYASVVPDKYPFVKPVMIFFPKGDREKGLEQLRQASEKAKYAKVESMYFLMQNYFVYEKDFPKALELARKLNAKYPDNSMFHRYVGRCLVSMGYISEAKTVFGEIERRCKNQQLGYDTYDAREAYYYLGKFDFMSGKFDTALQYLYRSDELSRKIDKDEPSGFMALTNLIIGNIYDMQGKRQYAEIQYKKVLDMKEYDNSHKDSEKYLAVPYTRGK